MFNFLYLTLHNIHFSNTIHMQHSFVMYSAICVHRNLTFLFFFFIITNEKRYFKSNFPSFTWTFVYFTATVILVCMSVMVQSAICLQRHATFLFGQP